MEIAFYEIAGFLLAASAVGLIGSVLRQPVIVSFIAVGIVAAAVFELAPQTRAQIGFLAELGVSLLLFLVGLKLDLRLVRTLGPVALATGLGQVAFTAGVGFLIGLALGLDAVTSLYVAVALTFSSTIIIVKLLTDKRELETLHGRIALGFLIVQDVVVVLAMLFLSTFGIGEGGIGHGGLAGVILGMVAMVALLALFMRYAAEPVMTRFARTPELLVVFAIGWAACAASLGELVGFGKEMGGLAAGVSLGSTTYREMVSARLASMRDFLLLFFFLSIGSALDLSTLGEDVGRAVIFSVFVLIGNPLIVVLIMAYMGYRARTGFLAGLTVAQISEFSLIFMAMGLSLGHVDKAAVGLVTLVGLVTIALSVYMITYSSTLYGWSRPLLDLIDRMTVPGKETASPEDSKAADVVLFGLGRFGASLYERLEDAGYTVLGVDLDPRVVGKWRRRGYRVRYGDVTDQDFWAELPLGTARWIVLAVPFGAIRLTETDPAGGLLAAIRTHRFQGRVALSARGHEEDGDIHWRADLILRPFDDAALAAADKIRALDEEARGQCEDTGA
jgi:Kef-type K+ transport system membrane component KefB